MGVEEPNNKTDSALPRGSVEQHSKDQEKPEVQGDEKETNTSEDGESQENIDDVQEKDENKAKPPRLVYSKEDLMALKNSPGSLLWPSFFSQDFVRNGIWDPEAWHQSSASEKRAASPVDDIRRHMLEDGIVLSPQRQSFGKGCHVPQSAPERGSQQERTKSMLTRTLDREPRDGRNRLTGRVGRGSRSLDYRDRQPLRDRNSDLRRLSPWDKERGDGKRGRDYDNRYSRDKRSGQYEEPEWMTYEPDNNQGTVELRGFDEDMVPERYRKGKSGSFIDELPSAKKGRKSSTSKQEKGTPDKQEGGEGNDDKGFDINQFFMSDTILQFSGGADQGNASRFSQFFGSHGSNSGSRSGSRRSSAAEEIMEYSGLSSGSPGTPHSPSPTQPFVFAPIKPVDATTDPESLAEMLEKSKIDVKPLLENVLSSEKADNARVKGPCRLEDIEVPAKEETEKAEISTQEDVKTPINNMDAFLKLVNTMKSSGNLPNKPQPAISGLPSKYLPRPPTPKDKSRTPSPTPLQKMRRSPSPAQMVHQLMMQTAMTPIRPPSPPQVVPQMEGTHSPFEILHKSIVMSPQDLLPSPLQRSPSPINYMYHPEKGIKPLLGPDAFTSPVVVNRPYVGPRTPMDRPRYDLPMNSPAYGKSPHLGKMHMGRPLDVSKTASPVMSAFKDPAFMPTSVLMHMKKGQMTPKGKTEETPSKEDLPDRSMGNAKGGDTKLLNGAPNRTTNQGGVNSTGHQSGQVQEARPLSPKSQLLREIAAHGPISKAPFGVGSQSDGPGSPVHSRNLPPGDGGSPLWKPTAFRPYTGAQPYSPVRSGSHSEPQSPMVTHSILSPNSSMRPVPHSAPVTPQRYSNPESITQRSLQGTAVVPQLEELDLRPERQDIRGLPMERDILRPSDVEGHLRRGHPEQKMEPERSVNEGTASRPEMGSPRVSGSNGQLNQAMSRLEHEKRLEQRQERLAEAHRMQEQNRANEMPRYTPGQQGPHQQMAYRRENVPDYRRGRPGIPDTHSAGRQGGMMPHPGPRPPLHDLPHPHPQDMFRQRHIPPQGHGIPNDSISQQALLRSPRWPMQSRTPFNSPMTGIPQHQKQGVPTGFLRSPMHPGVMRMMPPAGRVPGMPMQSPMMSPQSPLMYGPRMQGAGFGGVSPGMLPQQSPHYPLPARPPAPMFPGGIPPRVSSPQPLYSDQGLNKLGNENILSKWFSDDVLRVNQIQHSAPKSQKAPDFGKKVLSLEEVERQHAMVNT